MILYDYLVHLNINHYLSHNKYTFIIDPMYITMPRRYIIFTVTSLWHPTGGQRPRPLTSDFGDLLVIFYIAKLKWWLWRT